MAEGRHGDGARSDEERRRLEEEKRRLEAEIEEILRRKGEQPGRARRGRRGGTGLPPVPTALGNAVRYLLVIAVAAVLLFLSLRVLGPAAIRLAITAGLVFLFFYTVRSLLLDIIQRRRR